MPRESVYGHWFRAAVRGAVGALVFLLPSVPGAAASALTGPGVSHGGTIEVLPPASTSRTQSAGLFATACTAPGSCVAGGEYQAAGKDQRDALHPNTTSTAVRYRISTIGMGHLLSGPWNDSVPGPDISLSPGKWALIK